MTPRVAYTEVMALGHREGERKMPDDAVAFVRYDDDAITGLVCRRCVDPEDDKVVPIVEPGVVVCDVCGKVAR